MVRRVCRVTMVRYGTEVVQKHDNKQELGPRELYSKVEGDWNAVRCVLLDKHRKGADDRRDVDVKRGV